MFQAGGRHDVGVSVKGRSICRSLAVFCGAWAFVAPPAFGAHGDRWQDPGCCVVRGMRANFQVNSPFSVTGTPGGSDGRAIYMRVHLEAVYGMAQIGIMRTNVSINNDCFHNSAPQVMWEWKVASPTSMYRCTYGAALPTTYPYTRRFTVQRTGGTGDWSFYYEGAFQAEKSVGYDTASYRGGVGGEYPNSSYDTNLHADTVIGTGSFPWARTAQADSPHTWTTVNNHSGWYASTGWTIGTPSSPASPFVADLD